MSDVKIFFKDGQTLEFPETSRPGGSYHTSIKLTEGWVTITDAWGKSQSFPADTVSRVQNDPGRSW